MGKSYKPNRFEELKEGSCFNFKKKEAPTMTEQGLRKMIAAGESTRQEFKSWVKCKDYRQRKELAVKSAVALAKSGHQTGRTMEGVASAALNSPKYSSTTKTLAGSVLSQSDKNR